MSITQFIRDIQKIPEETPTPGAIIYDAIPAKFLRGPHRKIAQDIANRIDSGTLIDLGSGTGDLCIEIAKTLSKAKVYGIDLSKRMVKIARRYAGSLKNVQFEVGNAEELSSEDDSVDFIVSTGSLHHWRKPVKVFNECYRVLKNGQEARSFGYSDISKEEADKAMERKYSLPAYWILKKVLELHGFTEKEYRGRIKDIVEQTEFRDSYKMEQTGIWMKIIAHKYA